MPTQNTIANSLAKQLKIENLNVVSSLNDIIDDSKMNSYNDIKLLSKNLKNYLNEHSISIQHSKVLNILAKTLGYQNHHSLKKNFNNETKEIELNLETDSALRKLFLIKNQFLNKFDIQNWQIGFLTHQGYEFDFMYFKDRMTLRSKEKVEINKYLKSYGFKPYKNVLQLCKIKYDDIQNIALNILRNYQSFFKPIWYENDETFNNPTHLYSSDVWAMLSYKNIDSKKGYLLVDSYSNDLPWNIIINFLDYLFNFGTLKDVEFFEKCILNKGFSDVINTSKTFAELSRVYQWEEKILLKSMREKKRASISETFNALEYVIHIPEYLHSHLIDLEKANNKTIKRIIIDTADYIYNLNRKSSMDIIENKLFIDLLKKEKEVYIENMEKLNDIQIYKSHKFMKNAIKLIAGEVEKLIKIFHSINLH